MTCRPIHYLKTTGTVCRSHDDDAMEDMKAHIAASVKAIIKATKKGNAIRIGDLTDGLEIALLRFVPKSGGGHPGCRSKTDLNTSNASLMKMRS